MIELRWLHQGSADTRPTLQFRTWVIRIDASGAMTPLPMPIEWTEWQSVPHVIQHLEQPIGEGNEH